MTADSTAGKDGISFDRTFSRKDIHPYDEIEWERRTAVITGRNGEKIFEQEDVEVPAAWSQLATNVVASKYFHGENGSDKRERSLRQLIERVTRTITDWGREDGIFSDERSAEVFYSELTWLCLNQYGSFNSPVWFNCGLHRQYGGGRRDGAGGFRYDRRNQRVIRSESPYEYPQCSACFIQSVDDTMESIMDLARSEAMLFKYGSGSGTDLSSLRSKREKLSGGGRPSGPLSFLRIYDSIAGAIKSGGKTRRAAKMNTLRVDHPDIKEFIQAKSCEERKAWALIEQGYDGDFNGEAYASVAFQNENLTVRLSDAFLQAVEDDGEWNTRLVTEPNRPGPVYKARDVMRWIAEGTWLCGDPGVQYDDTIQRWNTCRADGTINSSNPCSEFMFLDDTACNLASLNLMKFLRADGVFDTERFRAAIEIFITAQEILVDHASYPTEKIALRSHRYRPLGLGYANLGALIMACGRPYDSSQGRDLAGGITALMTLHAYTQSARLAACRGPFAAYNNNRDSIRKVLRQHVQALESTGETCPPELRDAAAECGRRALEAGERHGYRNSQTTVLAPTGTIGFMMDCDTTGVEPDIALVKYKGLAGGGMLKLVNRTVPMALQRLGYAPQAIEKIANFIEEQDTIEGAPEIAAEHLPVFDCAFKPRRGKRYIPYTGHLKMMGAVQPFLSGAISKTVNMPEHATVEDIVETYLAGWKLGLKAVAVYRDGCKRSQPVNTGRREAKPAPADSGQRPLRRRLPDTRQSLTHKFSITGHEGYLTVGLYENGEPGELFITMAKEGSTIGGLMDCFGTAISICLQYGVPLDTLVSKFSHQRFEPSGITSNPDVRFAKSIPDYIFRWLASNFPPAGAADTTPAAVTRPATDAPQEETGKDSSDADVDSQFSHFMEDAPICDICGAITVRNGSCYRCFNCGNSLGCS